MSFLLKLIIGWCYFLPILLLMNSVKGSLDHLSGVFMDFFLSWKPVFQLMGTVVRFVMLYHGYLT